MNQIIDKLFERGVAVVAFAIGLFHVLNVSGLFVLSTRDVRIFHLMMMLVLLFMTRASIAKLAESSFVKLLRVCLIGIR